MRYRHGPAILLVVALAGCGGPATPEPASTPAPASAPAPATASATAGGPSEQARLVCEPEAREDIAELVGIDAQQVGPPTVTPGRFTCRYQYADGSFTLTVQDLDSGPATDAAYSDLAARLGRTGDIDLGGTARAFSTAGGSVVLRKDDKVMLVDVTALPATFGRPPVTRANAALLIMKAILGCWTE